MSHPDLHDDLDRDDAPLRRAAPGGEGHRPRKIDLSEVERRDGSRVTEVTAMYGSTVLDVQHVGQVESRRASAPVSMAFGALMILVGGGAFAIDVAQDWDGHRRHVEAAYESGRPTPSAPGTGLGALGIALAFLGLVPLVTGAIRGRDVGLGGYTIGEGRDVTFCVPPQGLPDPASFSLVSGTEHEATLGFTSEMTGFVDMEGRRRTLAELATSGLAQWMGSSYAFPLPPGALGVVEYAGVVFRVRPVAPGRRIAQELQVDKPFWFYNLASLAILGPLLVLTHFVPDEAFDMGLEDLAAETRFVGIMKACDSAVANGSSHTQDDAHDDAPATRQRSEGEGSKAPKAASIRATDRAAVRLPRDAVPAMARNLTPEMAARNAGILAMIGEHGGSFLASPHGGAFSIDGGGDEDLWGDSTAALGETAGVAGLGLVGTGRGGGGTGEGTVGFDELGLGLGGGGGGCSGGAGRGCGIGRPAGAGFGGRGKRVPQVRMAQATVCGGGGGCGIGKDIIRRVVRAHINEVRHCYNQGLVRNPKMTGRVAIQFTIDPMGRVPASVVEDSSIGDADVARCIAKAVRRWFFPKPNGGGHVVVSYPFVLAPG